MYTYIYIYIYSAHKRARLWLYLPVSPGCLVVSPGACRLTVTSALAHAKKLGSKQQSAHKTQSAHKAFSDPSLGDGELGSSRIAPGGGAAPPRRMS